jgi:hypothetical protein
MSWSQFVVDKSASSMDFLFGTQGMARRAPVGEVVEILAHLKMRFRGSALL